MSQIIEDLPGKTRPPIGALPESTRLRLRNGDRFHYKRAGYYMVFAESSRGVVMYRSSEVSFMFCCDCPGKDQNYYFNNYFHALAYFLKLQKELEHE